MKPTETREEFQCNTCGETWVHGGDARCPFCGSEDTGPKAEDDDPTNDSQSAIGQKS